MVSINKLKVVLTVIVFSLSICFVSISANAQEQLPKINFLGIEHSPLVEGDNESFYITSDYEGLVQYRAWMKKLGNNSWEDITKGYMEAIDAKTPYIISPDRKFTEGKYQISVWVKRAGIDGVSKNDNGTYDAYYISNLNCVKKDDNNRVYVNGSMEMEKTEYQLGEEVVISGINNIGGIQGPYKYKLHYFSPNKANGKDSGWEKNITDYNDKIVWTPTEAGIYVLDVHVNTEKSTTWNTYLKRKKENKLNDVSGTYEAWKLKIITVKAAENPEGTGTSTFGSDILESLSIVLSNGQEITASGNEREVNADISNFKDTDKLLYLNIKVFKDCTLEIKGVDKKFILKANETNKIFPNDLESTMDEEKDGVSMINVRKYFADKNGYMITNQKITYGSKTINTIFKIKVK